MKFNQAAFDMIKRMPPFRPELREANRKNLKTQTRRVADQGFWPTFEASSKANTGVVAMEMMDGDIRSPYGYKTDLRYMSEPLYRGFGGVAYYQDDDVMVINLLTGEPISWNWQVKVLSQRYMPKIAARTFKRYDFIRVERLRDITREDARAEGVSNIWEWNNERDKKYFKLSVLNPYVANFSVLWDDINADRGFDWDSNPWVWVIGYHNEFEKVAE